MMNNDILHIERDKLIQSIFEIKDVAVIKKLRTLVTKSAKLPAVMTVEEMRASAMQGIEDARQGKGKPMEQLFEEAKEW
jgi:hypothetical protein